MFYQKVHAPVEVVMSFRKEHPEPIMFKWNGRFYSIKRVNLVHAERVGQKRIYYFSVSDAETTYRLGFCTESLAWWLEEVCVPNKKREMTAVAA